MPAPSVRLTVNPRARALRVRIDPFRREAVAVLPSQRQARAADRFLSEHADWIAAKLAALPPARPFVEGGVIPVRGVDHRLARPATRGRIAFEAGPEPRILAPAPADTFAARVRRALIAEARADAEPLIARYALALGVAPPKLTVKDTKSRWGSCAPDGSIALSWRLICAPPFVLDYVCAHEAAHIRVRDHSPRFWRLVADLYGDPAPARRWLDREGPTLFAIGAAR